MRWWRYHELIADPDTLRIESIEILYDASHQKV